MALADYGRGNRRSFIYILESNRGKGWQGVAEALWLIVAKRSFNKGASSSWPLVPMFSHPNKSYKEVLTLPMAEQRGRKGGGKVLRSRHGADSLRTGSRETLWL